MVGIACPICKIWSTRPQPEYLNQYFWGLSATQNKDTEARKNIYGEELNLLAGKSYNSDRWPDREWSRRRIFKNIMKEEKLGVRYRCWCWCWCCQSSESDRWPEKGGWRDGSTQLSRPGDVFVQNFFLIGPSPANLYAPHLYFYTTRLKNAALLDLTIGARVEFLRD